MGGDNQAANTQVELVPGPMPDLEVIGVRFRGVPTFFSLGLLQGYSQIPLTEEAQDSFTVVLPSGPYTFQRVPREMMLNATAFFQSSMAEVLQGFYQERYMVGVDDLIVWGKRTQDEMLENFGHV